MRTALKTLVIAPGALEALKKCSQQDKNDEQDVCFSVVPRYMGKYIQSGVPDSLVIYSPSLYPKSSEVMLPKEVGYIEVGEQVDSTTNVPFYTAALYTHDTEDIELVEKVFNYITNVANLALMHTQ